MAHDVFISYSSDDKSVADAVCHTLESEGIRCWIAPRDIRAGQDWKPAIVEAIKDCEIMVLIFSGKSNRSDQVEREVDMAFEEGHPIVPFRIEDASMNAHFEYCIASRHWLDAMSEPLERSTDQLAENVRQMLGHESRQKRTGTARVGSVDSEADGRDISNSEENDGRGPDREKQRREIRQALEENRLQLIEEALSQEESETETVLQEEVRKLERERQEGLLWKAAEEGFPEVAAVLFEGRVDPETTDEDGMKPLHVAAQHGHPRVVDVLVEVGADLGATDDSGLTPLHWADDPEVVERLLEAGADIETTTDYGKTPLHVAAGLGDTNVAEILIEAGADPNAKTSLEGVTPLHGAAAEGHPEATEVLLEAGGNPEVTDDLQGGTPLALAAAEGHPEVAEALLYAGGDPDATDNEGLTPLHQATAGGHLEVAEILLEAGADSEATDSEGETPLQFAETVGDVSSNMEELVKSYKNVGTYSNENGEGEEEDSSSGFKKHGFSIDI